MSDSSSSSSFGFQVRRSPIPSKEKEVEDPVSDSGHESDHSSEAGRIAPKKKERKGAKVSKAFDKCREEAKKKNKTRHRVATDKGGPSSGQKRSAQAGKKKKGKSRAKKPAAKPSAKKVATQSSSDADEGYVNAALRANTDVLALVQKLTDAMALPADERSARKFYSSLSFENADTFRTEIVNPDSVVSKLFKNIFGDEPTDCVQEIVLEGIQWRVKKVRVVNVKVTRDPRNTHHPRDSLLGHRFIGSRSTVGERIRHDFGLIPKWVLNETKDNFFVSIKPGNDE